MRTYVQIIIGLVITFVLLTVSLAVSRSAKLVDVSRRAGSTSRQSTVVFDGYVDAALVSQKVYNTVDPLSSTFVSLPLSVNRTGGVQFSYSFWIFMGDTSPSNLANKHILMRGDSRPYVLADCDPNSPTGSTPDAVIYCPRISWGDTFDQFVVGVNTVQDPFQTITFSPILNNSQAVADLNFRQNIVSLIPQSWTLLTFTFEDHMSVNDYADGFAVRFFVDDMLYQVESRNGAIRPNNGALYLFPMNTDFQPPLATRFGNPTYYNYALSLSDVIQLYKKGPPKTYLADKFMSASKPLYISEYNKTDMLNYS